MRGQVGSRAPGRPGTWPPSCRMSAQPRNPESLPISPPFQCKDSPSLGFLPPATDRSSHSQTQPPTYVQCPAPFPLSANRCETRLSSTTLRSLQGNTKFSVIVGDPEREQGRRCPRRRSLQGSNAIRRVRVNLAFSTWREGPHTVRLAPPRRFQSFLREVQSSLGKMKKE